MTGELRLKINDAFQDESDELASLDEKIILWSKMLKREQKQLDFAIYNRRKLESADIRALTLQVVSDSPASVTQEVNNNLGARPKVFRA